MKLITRDTDYAIRALCCIAKSKKDLITTKDLVECLHIPRPFLRKILQALQKERMVHSYKGRSGGFKLAKPPDKITLVGLIEMFQGPISLSDHTFKKRPCPDRKSCRLKKGIDRIECIVVSELGHITISSLMKGEAK